MRTGSTRIPVHGRCRENPGVAWTRENAVARELVETTGTAVIGADAMEAIERTELVRVPMGRWATPEDLTAAYPILACEAAGLSSGQTLRVDGGSPAL